MTPQQIRERISAMHRLLTDAHRNLRAITENLEALSRSMKTPVEHKPLPGQGVEADSPVGGA